MINYITEEVNYENKSANITLSGTLTTPLLQKPTTVVILIAGYGPNDRDYTMAGNKHFLKLADHLTQSGFTVLRFDKRGVGKSTGVYETATSRDFADDVIASIQYLKNRSELALNKICLIGHSEGGMIASMVAAESKDINAIVLMAGVVETEIDNLIAQTALQMHADGATEQLIAHDKNIRKQIFTIIKKEANSDNAKNKLQECIKKYWEQLPQNLKIESDKIHFAISETKANVFINVFNSAWYRYFFGCQPKKMLNKINVPVLALYGDLDWIASPDRSIPIIEQELKKAENTNYVIHKLSGLNHIFQKCKTGAMAEYSTIKEPISSEVLKTISDWISKSI